MEYRLSSIRCPHCDTGARIRSSRQITRTYREIYLQCDNMECGHTFVADLTIVRTIAPSATPRADVNLQLAPRRARADNDNRPAAAAAAADG